MYLFANAPLTELMYVANELRKKQVAHGKLPGRSIAMLIQPMFASLTVNFAISIGYRVMQMPISPICRPIAKKSAKLYDMVETNCFCREAIIPS
jgi:hypothetical protein